jgi:hypothetical protein
MYSHSHTSLFILRLPLSLDSSHLHLSLHLPFHSSSHAIPFLSKPPVDSAPFPDGVKVNHYLPSGHPKMSTTDQPESGEISRDTIQPPVTTSPQDQQATAPTTELQPQPGLSADTSIASAHDQTPANQTQVHPATGPSSGKSESAPVTTSPTTNPPQTVDNTPAVALAQPTTPPSMETEEPKTAPETSTEHSDDGSGKEVEEDAGPSLAITLLLTTGSRHPFTIDGKYLRKRSVNVENFDPFLMSVYTLKELIWREWRSGKSFTP